MTAGDEEAAAARALGQDTEVAGRTGVEEAAASELEVGLEVVEDQDELFFGEGLGDEREAQAVVEVGARQEVTALGRRWRRWIQGGLR